MTSSPPAVEYPKNTFLECLNIASIGSTALPRFYRSSQLFTISCHPPANIWAAPDNPMKLSFCFDAHRASAGQPDLWAKRFRDGSESSVSIGGKEESCVNWRCCW